MNKLLKQTEFYIAVVIILLAIVITLFNPRFLSAENIFGLMKSYSVIGIMAVGELFVLILGGSPMFLLLLLLKLLNMLWSL